MILKTRKYLTKITAVTKFKGDVQAYKSLIVQNVSCSLAFKISNEQLNRSKTNQLDRVLHVHLHHKYKNYKHKAYFLFNIENFLESCL